MRIRATHQHKFVKAKENHINREIIIRLALSLLAMWLVYKILEWLFFIMASKRRESLKNSEQTVDRLVARYKRKLGGQSTTQATPSICSESVRAGSVSKDLLVVYKHAYEEQLLLMRQKGDAGAETFEMLTSMVQFFHDLQWGSGSRIQELDLCLQQWQLEAVGGAGWARWVRNFDDNALIAACFGWKQWKELLTGVALIDSFVRDARQKSAVSLQHLAQMLGETEEVVRAALGLLVGKLEEQSGHALLPQLCAVEQIRWGTLRESHPSKWARILLRLYWHREGRVRGGADHFLVCLKRAVKIVTEVRHAYCARGNNRGPKEWMTRLEISGMAGAALPSLELIKKQYRTLTLKYHPDRVLGVKGSVREQTLLTEKLTAIREAYEQLEWLIREENHLLEKIRFFSWEETNAE